MKAFETERTPQFVAEMKESARLVAELSDAVAGGMMTLEDAALRLVGQPSWSGTLLDARLMLTAKPVEPQKP